MVGRDRDNIKTSIKTAKISIILHYFTNQGGLEMKFTILAILLLPQFVSAAIKPTEDVFYVYEDGASRRNHYCPSGWAGDFSDMKFNPWFNKEKGDGKTIIQVTYTAEKRQGAGWAGIFYQNPCQNWGDRRGGYDLTGYKKLLFRAKGQKGGEVIDKFMIGGITGTTEDGDSDNNYTDVIELTKDWKEYEISLEKMDLKNIISGFSFFFNSDMNPNGLVMYIDDVRLIK